MRRALVIGDTGGIGSAVSAALVRNGDQVTGLSRSRSGLDLTDEASVQRVLGPVQGPFDLVFVASGALEIDGARPEKSLKQVRSAAMLDQFALNAVGPALICREAARLLPRDRRAVFAVLSARVGSIEDNRLGGWVSYRAAKAALNQVLRCTAIELARTHPHAICISLHPGTVATAVSRDYLGRHPAVTPAAAAENLLSVMDRLNANQSGGFFDWSGAAVPW